MILERLSPEDRNAAITSEHLESFANDGLRTLCLGYRVLEPEEYEVTIIEAKTTTDCRSEAMASEVSRSIDSDPQPE